MVNTTSTPSGQSSNMRNGIPTPALIPSLGNDDASAEKTSLSVVPSFPQPAVLEESSNAATATGRRRNSQQYVDHTYTDYVKFDEDDFRILYIVNKSYSSLPFPGKLLDVLDRGQFTDIVDWLPHGRSFIVKQPKIFTIEVLPRFFKQTKFLSFTRQLNIWGFKRITHGPDIRAYYHELFLPGRPNLTTRMKRTKIKGTGTKPIPNPSQEPNFYTDYPHVPKVPRSRMQIPLPPLPDERLFGMMLGARDPPTAAGYHVSAPPSYIPHIIQSSAMAGTPHIGADLSAARAAGLHSQGSVKPGLTPSSAIMGVSDIRSTAIPQDSFATSTLDVERIYNSYIRHATMREEAPQSFHPMNDGHNYDEVSRANHNLMQRLLAPSAHGAPGSMIQYNSSMTESNCPPNLISKAGHDTLIGRTSAAPPSSRPVQTMPYIHHENFQLQNPRRTHANEASAAAPRSFLVAPQDNRLYLHNAIQSNTVLGSSMQSTTQHINVHTVITALHQAQHFDELARNRRATAHALEDMLLKEHSRQFNKQG